MWTFSQDEFHIAENPGAVTGQYLDECREIVSLAGTDAAMDVITTWPGYRATPVVSSRKLSSSWQIRELHYKDESTRFGLGSFKALGGAYALLRLLQRLARSDAGSCVDTGGRSGAELGSITAVCATDGNHGRSLAWGARLFNCKCKVYVHRNVDRERIDAIAAHGAEIEVVDGTYDDAVRQAALDAETNGWFVVSDTSYAGYTDVPRDVMQGYTVMVEELDAELSQRGALPTHVFVQGGVGGLAAAVGAYYWEKYEARRPTLVVVEPQGAACLHASILAGRPVKVPGSLDTVMAGLACGEPSVLAWKILKGAADYFVKVPDRSVARMMKALASGELLDRPAVAGESAVAGLLGAEKCCNHPVVRDRLGISRDSVLVAFGTEGATAPALYAKMVGHAH